MVEHPPYFCMSGLQKYFDINATFLMWYANTYTVDDRAISTANPTG